MMFSTLLSRALFKGLIASTVCVSHLCFAQASEPCINSDVVFHNGVIYTADDKNWQAEVVAVENGRIVFVGEEADAVPWHCGAKNVLI